MAKSSPPTLLLTTVLFLLTISIPPLTAAYSIGVNYGTVADNLPPPSTIAKFLRISTYIDKVKNFDTNPDIISAFANTKISLTINILNSDVIRLTDLSAAQSWVSSTILPHYPQTNFRYIGVGNEVYYSGDKVLMANLVKAMKSVHQALLLTNITTIKVTSPFSYAIMSGSEPPSTGRFRRGYDRVLFAPVLEFLNQTGSPFMVNPYPYFGFTNKTLDYALFRPNKGLFDKVTGFNYTNMFEAQMDAVYIAMKRLGYEDVEIVVGETGWPSAGDPNTQPDSNMENAISYNSNLIKHVNSGVGTPLMPNRTFEVYVFSLFNENLKPSLSEQSFGLFKPDLNPVYEAGVLRSPQQAQAPTASTPRSAPSPGAAADEKKWCMPKQDASDDTLQGNLDYACSHGVDCQPIQDGGPCFQPNTVISHAAFAMNAYYQIAGKTNDSCNFGGTGIVISDDPSYEACQYAA